MSTGNITRNGNQYVKYLYPWFSTPFIFPLNQLSLHMLSLKIIPMKTQQEKTNPLPKETNQAGQEKKQDDSKTPQRPKPVKRPNYLLRLL